MTDFLDTFAELNAAFGARDDAVTVALELVYEDPHQPRETFDAAELEALADSIRRRGVLQPIVLQPCDPDGRYRIRFGARRYRAARLAGLAEIRAFVRGGEASEAEILIEQTLENDQRAALTTAERARTVSRLLAMGLSQADISRELGQPKDVVAMLAAVQKMPPVLQTLATALGARTLYELFAAWRADAAGVEAWLARRDPQAITQAEARSLATSRSERKVAARGVASGPAADLAGGAPPGGGASAGRRSPPPGPAVTGDPNQDLHLVEVSMRGRIGVLDLTRAPARDGEAWVRFEDTGMANCVPLAELVMERIRGPRSPARSGPGGRGKG
jgi:ParB family chromosome partitioning protein